MFSLHTVFHVHYKFYLFSDEIYFDGSFFIHCLKCYLFSNFFLLFYSVLCIVSSQMLVYSWESSIMSVCNWILPFRQWKPIFSKPNINTRTNTKIPVSYKEIRDFHFFFLSLLCRSLENELARLFVCFNSIGKMKLKKCRLGIKHMTWMW